MPDIFSSKCFLYTPIPASLIHGTTVLFPVLATWSTQRVIKLLFVTWQGANIHVPSRQGAPGCLLCQGCSEQGVPANPSKF